MGEKSRRNNKTGNDAATSSVADRAATATAAAASLGTTSSRCYHGSTIDRFQPNSEYMKAL
ncbi:MAG: hypothetical protein ACI90V_010639 [Bacillariaceae sp.]|jgi:hypothetical protein